MKIDTKQTRQYNSLWANHTPIFASMTPSEYKSLYTCSPAVQNFNDTRIEDKTS